MKYLLMCITFLILCLNLSYYISNNHYLELNNQKYKETNKQLSEAIQLIGIGGHGEKTNKKVKIDNIIEKQGLKNYEWRYKDIAFPLKEESTYITSEFNEIRYNLNQQKFFEVKSIDMKCVDDDRVRAGIDGICRVGHDNVYGNFIIIKNGKYEIQYSHLERVDVEEDQVVKTNDIIGIVGNSGHCMIYDYRLKKWRDIKEYERDMGRGKHLDMQVKINGISKNIFANSLHGNEL